MVKRTSQPVNLPSLLIPREEAAQRIKEQIRKGRRISNQEMHTKAEASKGQGSLYKWANYTFELLSRAFDSASLAKEFRKAGDAYLVENPTYRQIGQWINQSAASSVLALENILSRLDLIPEAADLRSPSSVSEQAISDSICRDVFVVHGHDDAAKDAAARLIDKLGLNAIILHEQANLNRTIIEKLERHSSVCFAVVILTPDDIGWPASDSSQAKPRARQNVIFELGYFIGKLGRDKVCALYKGDVEIPSDFQGVLYLPLDHGGIWRLKLAKEMKEAGINVDLTKAY